MAGNATAAPLPTALAFTRPDLTLADALINGGDPADSVTAAGFATISSNYVGPYGGTLSASATADGTFGLFRLNTNVAISNYGQGSFVDFYDGILSNYLPAPAGASLRVNDVMTIVGPDPTYNLAFTWTISGSTASTNPQFVNSQINMAVRAPGISSSAFNAFGFDNNTWSLTRTFTLFNIPSNTSVAYNYSASTVTWVEDCYYDLSANYVCTSPATYSASQIIDFANTFRMTDFSIFRSNGERATGVGYLSQNGFVFPGNALALPEPSSAFLAAFGLAVIALRARRR